MYKRSEMHQTNHHFTERLQQHTTQLKEEDGRGIPLHREAEGNSGALPVPHSTDRTLSTEGPGAEKTLLEPDHIPSCDGPVTPDLSPYEEV